MIVTPPGRHEQEKAEIADVKGLFGKKPGNPYDYIRTADIRY
jgi:hypothetical protein